MQFFSYFWSVHIILFHQKFSGLSIPLLIKYRKGKKGTLPNCNQLIALYNNFSCISIITVFLMLTCFAIFKEKFGPCFHFVKESSITVFGSSVQLEKPNHPHTLTYFLKTNNYVFLSRFISLGIPPYIHLVNYLPG